MQLISRVLGVVFALAFLSGCFGIPDPKLIAKVHYIDPTNEKVLVYPMYDMRQDKELSLKLEGYFDYSKWTVNNHYMGTNFGIIVRRDAANTGITPKVTFDDFNEGTDKLRYLNHGGEKYVLAIFLLEFSKSELALSVEMQGFLVNTETGAVEWSDSGADISELGAEFDFAYLEGKVNLSNSASESFENALVEMLQSFPTL